MMPRIMIAGTKSGCGKTTVTCAVLQALKNRGFSLMACKSGPDYIDPMFHSRIIGTESCNLDLFLGSPELIRHSLRRHSGENDLTVMEGAMGFYDGIAMTSEASAWQLAQVTQTPVILVVDGRGTGVSVCAEIMGFCSYQAESKICGVVLNRVSPMLYPRLKAVIEAQCGIKVLGYLPKLEECAIKSRHLGLMTAGEISDLKEKLLCLAEFAEKSLDLDGMVAMAADAPDLPEEELSFPAPVEGEPVIAVAKDEAFCFYYRDSLELLQQLGGKMVWFSPLHDAQLPPCDGLYLGGGYPELYAEQLAANRSMRASVRGAVEKGLPTIAECGGFLYLHRWLEDERGIAHEMCGVLPERAYPTGRLQRFGYIAVEAEKDCLLCSAGEHFPAHEFHYWESSAPGKDFYARKPLSDRGWVCGYGSETLYGGFPHLYLPAKPEMAKRFLQKAVEQRGK